MYQFSAGLHALILEVLVIWFSMGVVGNLVLYCYLRKKKVPLHKLHKCYSKVAAQMSEEMLCGMNGRAGHSITAVSCVWQAGGEGNFPLF